MQQALYAKHFQQLNQENIRNSKIPFKHVNFQLPPESQVAEKPTYALKTTTGGDHRA
jgi:hypothetical protein